MMTMNVSTGEGGDRSAEGGGINWRHVCQRWRNLLTYSRLPPTWIFASFAHISTSAKKMKMDYCLHSNSAVVSAVSPPLDGCSEYS
jgi:hypothetical protein